MPSAIPATMKAVAIDQFGGVEQLKLRTLPVPAIDADEVLIKAEFAGVAVWDPYEREGGFEELVKQITGEPTKFPLVLGSEGAGTVAAVGANATKFKVGDHVYAAPFLSPKGGFYSEYVAAKADVTSHIPDKLSVEQAAVMVADAATALRGLDDVLKLKRGESVMIFGAGGGIGHLAVQLAKNMGARVFAVASGEDGVALAKKLGADAVVNGRKDDVAATAKTFAPNGLDTALLTAGGGPAEKALAAMSKSGRIAHPTGIMPEPKAPAGLTIEVYDANPEGELIARMNKLIEAGPFDVNVAKTFTLAQAADAHRFLAEHYLGKISMKIA